MLNSRVGCQPECMQLQRAEDLHRQITTNGSQSHGNLSRCCVTGTAAPRRRLVSPQLPWLAITAEATEYMKSQPLQEDPAVTVGALRNGQGQLAPATTLADANQELPRSNEGQPDCQARAGGRETQPSRL